MPCMTDAQDQLRQAARDLYAELQKVMDQAGRLAKQAGDDFSRLVGDPRTVVPRRPREATATDAIRDLGRLRDEGLITEDEFQAKKSELLSRI